MALFKIFKGNSSNLPKTYKDGYCYFTVNDGKMYIDTKDSDSTGRICLNAEKADKLATARTITIGNTGKSFNGTANISYNLTEIGCANRHATTWDFSKSYSSGYDTFDVSKPNGGPVENWINGFVSTHNNYLSSFLINVHRSADWYVGYSEHSVEGTSKMPVWSKLLHSSNYNQYAPTLTGTGASGTWGINITGNAATATKATQDGSGNVITSTYLKLSGGNLTGSLVLTNGKDLTLQAPSNNPDDSGDIIWRRADGTEMGRIWGFSDGKVRVRFNDSSGGYTLLHSNNYSDYAVPISGGTMTGGLTTPGLAISNKSAQYTAFNMHGSGRFYFQMIPDSNSVRNHFRYVDSTTGKYIDYYLGNDATSLSETKGCRILTGENYSSYALPLSGGTITGQLNVKGAFVAENTSYMYGSIISVGGGLYDRYNNTNYEMIVSYKNGNTVLGASGGGLYIGYQNTTYLNIGNLGNWAYWDASVLRLNQEIQSTNVHPLRSVYGDYGMIFRNDGSNFWFLPTAAGDQYGSWAKTYTRINLASGQIYGAVWNDYAEFRQYTDSEEIPYGRVVCENGDGSLSISTKRLQLGANICSDTFGQAIGEKDDVKMPIAVAGRVLAYPYEDRNSYIPGEPVCAGPNGTVSKMTREEIKEYPECIIGTVSEVPQYEEWNEIKVNGRIWIKVK